MSNKDIYEYNLEDLLRKEEIIDRVGSKECVLRIRPLYLRDIDKRFKRVRRKYLLIGRAPNGSFEVVISDKYRLILNSNIEKIKDIINADSIKIDYWSGTFMAEVNASKFGVYVYNSYVKSSSFKVQPTIKISYKGTDFYLRLPISFVKEHLGSSDLLKAFLNNLNFMLDQLYKNKELILKNINKNVDLEVKELINEKVNNYFNRKIRKLYEESKLDTYLDYLYFFSERYKEALKDSNLRTEILRQEIINYIFSFLDQNMFRINFDIDNDKKVSKKLI